MTSTATVEWIRLQTSILNLRNACAAEPYAALRGAAHGLTPRSPLPVLERIRRRAERIVQELGITAPVAQRFQVVMLDGSKEHRATVQHLKPVTPARAEALVMLRNPERRVVKVKAIGGAP